MPLTMQTPDGATKIKITDSAVAMLKALELGSGLQDHEILDAAIQAQRVALIPVAKKAGRK